MRNRQAECSAGISRFACAEWCGELIDAHDAEQGEDHFDVIADQHFLAAAAQASHHPDKVADADEIHPRHIGYIKANLGVRGGKAG
ncbi:hypothetical protein [Sulfuricella sp. T08]|uniref:hypothetical protein n=1 Tax=Sulfuricella sp. T08 TaxID=1632857 RepID=UPI00075191E4|nr:hypothetical protein [Sulfuricella sp. T08]